MNEPALDLETVIRRDRPPEMLGSIQIDTVDDDTRVTLSFGDDRDVIYAVLSPAEAKTIATALEEAAVQAEAAAIVEEQADE
ncbi:hypothetical protein [Halorubrum tebenquichense]|uniref:Uncharacterized protein n=1 Tax=Halorubrum tebenquichense DSM 14210 TaxID=1227485 RepID=M0DV59_9EURY|nr:hypothetical protein [Halorubrum tebenquichense]ELZ39410.1 hypothetical protein C472_03828 [Halorubrum tebenquichense DSM 14210]